MYAIMKDFNCNFLTFVKTTQINCAIRIALDQSEEGATWGSVNHMKVMVPGNKLEAHRHNDGLPP
jgi:hypothetical protein